MNIWFKLATGLIIFMVGFTSAIGLSRNHYGTVIAKMNEKAAVEAMQAAEAVEKSVLNNDATKAKLKEKENEANTALAYLVNHPAGRVLIPHAVPACPNSPPVTAGAVPAASSERADDRGQRLLDDATEHLKSRAAEWSKALNSCANLQEWAKIQ